MTASPPLLRFASPSPIRPGIINSPRLGPPASQQGPPRSPPTTSLIKERTRSLGDSSEWRGNRAEDECESPPPVPHNTHPTPPMLQRGGSFGGRPTSPPIAVPLGVALPPPLVKPLRIASETALTGIPHRSGSPIGDILANGGDSAVITPRSLAPASVALPPPLIVSKMGSGGGGVVPASGGGEDGDSASGGGAPQNKSPRSGNVSLQARIQQLKILKQNYSRDLSQSDDRLNILNLQPLTARSRVGNQVMALQSKVAPMIAPPATPGTTTSPSRPQLRRTLSGSNLGAMMKKDTKPTNTPSTPNVSNPTTPSTSHHKLSPPPLAQLHSKSSEELLSSEEREKNKDSLFTMKRQQQMVTKLTRNLPRASTMTLTRGTQSPSTTPSPSPSQSPTYNGGGLVKTISATSLAALPMRLPPFSPPLSMSMSSDRLCMSPPPPSPSLSPTNLSRITRRDMLYFPDEEVDLLFFFLFSLTKKQIIGAKRKSLGGITGWVCGGDRGV